MKPSENLLLRNGVDWVDHRVLFLSVAVFDLSPPISSHFLLCSDQSSSSRQLMEIFFTGADESRIEEEEGSLVRSHTEILFHASFYLPLLAWRPTCLDRLAKLWGMWSPLSCCHSSFLSGQYQIGCQIGDPSCFLQPVPSGNLLRVCCPLTALCCTSP